MLEHRQPLLLPDRVWERAQAAGIKPVQATPGRTSQSWLGVPIMIGDHYLGTMVVLSYTTPRAYDERSVDLLTSIAGHTAITLENVRLLEETRAALTETQTLFRVARGLAQAQSQQEMFELVLTEYLNALGLPQGGVMTLDPTGGYGILHALMQDGRLVEAGMRISIADNPPTVQALTTKEPVVIRDAEHDALTAPIRDLVDQQGYKSLLLVPIIVRGESIGLLGADSVDEIHDFSEREINLVRAVADQLGLAMEHQRLLEETRTLLEEAQARARRERLLREFTARLRGLTDPDAVARTAVRELGAALGRPAFIRLGDSAQ